MQFVKQVWAVFLKDLLIEMRKKEIFVSSLLFAVAVILMIAFSFGEGEIKGTQTAAGSLWLTVTFAGVIIFNRTFERERAYNAYKSLFMTAASPAALFLGKLAGVFTFLFALGLITWLFTGYIFHVNVFLFPGVVLIIFAGIFGYSCLGTLFGAATLKGGIGNIMLGLILYPLVIPLLIMSVSATVEIYNGVNPGDTTGWILVIDLIFLLGGLWFFGPVMED